MMARSRASGLAALLTLGSLPSSLDFGLLVLRLTTGATLLALHGWPKVGRLFGTEPRFADPLGIGVVPSLALATIAEVIGSALLMIGLATRWAAAALLMPLVFAFFTVHGGALRGENNGELPFVFAAAMLAILIAGPGRYSVDARLDPRLDGRRTTR